MFCGVLAAGMSPFVQAANPNPQQAFQQSYTLSPRGRVAIDNLYGDVRVTGWDRNEVRVEAIKTGTNEERLEDARIVVDATADRISVRTLYASAESRSPASVEYHITMPRTADLEEVHLINGGLVLSDLAGSVKATSVNGGIRAEKLAGKADLATVNGPVEAGFERIDATRPISLRSVNGHIQLSIPSGSGAQLIAQNRSGEIETNFKPHTRTAGSHHLEAVLPGGGPTIELHNVNGGISIHSTWSRRHERPCL